MQLQRFEPIERKSVYFGSALAISPIKPSFHQRVYTSKHSKVDILINSYEKGYFTNPIGEFISSVSNDLKSDFIHKYGIWGKKILKSLKNTSIPGVQVELTVAVVDVVLMWLMC